jgi:branched-chain amino acid aminotransferase
VPGTASEVTPVRSVDKIKVGLGKAGEITMRIQRLFLDLVHGKGRTHTGGSRM